MLKARPIAFALLVAFAPAAVSLPRIASAQNAPDDALTKAARARFQEGVDAFDKGNFEAARAAFKQAYALKQHPAVLLNLAQSSLKSGHFLEAARFFQQYLNDPQGDKKADATKGLTDARSKLGRLDVNAPPGSGITVDTDVVGKTPMNEAVDVEAGNHTVKAKLPDGTSSEQHIVVTAGQVQPVRFGAAATVVNPPTNPTNPPTNPETHPPANPPTNLNPENPPQNPPPQNPPVEQHGEKVHPAAALPLMIAGGALAVGGFVIAGVFAGVKSSANDNYINVQNRIINAQKLDGINPQTCNASQLTAAQQLKYTTDSSGKTSPCTTLKNNQDAVNQDATVANAFLVVGIVGTAAAVGGVLWYILGAKNEEPARTAITRGWLQAPPASRSRNRSEPSRRNVGNIAPALADVVACPR